MKGIFKKKFFNCKIEAFDGVYYWYIKKNKIFKSFSDKGTFEAEHHISIPNKYVRNYFPLLKRLLRTGIHNVIPINDGCIVVVKGKLLYYKKTKLKKIIKIPRGSRPLRNAISIQEKNLFFGDYWGNKKRKNAHVYKLNLESFDLQVILSLKVRHIHFIVSGKEKNQLIIGTGDEDHECQIMLFNYKTREKLFIGKGSQKFRAVSIIQYNDLIIWGTDAPNEKNFIYSYGYKTNQIKKLKEISGPVYYSTITAKGELYIATAIEKKKRHRAILYKSSDGKSWESVKEFKKDFFNEKLFGYGLIEFIHGQEKVGELNYNLINLYELS